MINTKVATNTYTNTFKDTNTRAQDKMIFPKFGDDDKSGTFHHCIACVKCQGIGI